MATSSTEPTPNYQALFAALPSDEQKRLISLISSTVAVGVLANVATGATTRSQSRATSRTNSASATAPTPATTTDNEGDGNGVNRQNTLSFNTSDVNSTSGQQHHDALRAASKAGFLTEDNVESYDSIEDFNLCV